MTKKKTIDYNYASKVTNYFLTHNNFLIVTHKNPDGDTMGSAAALCSALRRSGKTAFLYPNKQITEKLRKYTAAFFAAENYTASSIISVDVASPDMMAEGFTGTIDCCIDHHPTLLHRSSSDEYRPGANKSDLSGKICLWRNCPDDY